MSGVSGRSVRSGLSGVRGVSEVRGVSDVSVGRRVRMGRGREGLEGQCFDWNEGSEWCEWGKTCQ